MKRLFLLATIVASIILLLSACSKENPREEPVKPVEGNLLELFGDGKQIGNGTQSYNVKPGNYLLKKGVYTLKGWVYIPEGSSLTIPAGTIIKGDKATQASIIVQRGGKLIAKGTAQEPIVFTSAQPAGSRKPGDWGGIIMCGKAVNNQTEAIVEGGPDAMHGGNDDNDNSGVLSYVRIEFAGYPYKKDQEINGLTLASVGRGTQIDHVQVSYSNDDSFEWFGGSVNCKYLIAYKGWDDDFDTDFGFSGSVQFALSVRDSRIADTSWSNCFESDNDGKGSTKTPWTSCRFSNVTSIGPMIDPNFKNDESYINGGNMNPNNGAQLGSFLSGMQIRRNAHHSIHNAVFIGWPVGLIVENDKGSTTQTWATKGDLKISNIVFAGNGIVGTDVNKKTTPIWSDGQAQDANRKPFSEEYFFSNTSNRAFASIAELKLASPNAAAGGFDPRPLSGSPLLSGAGFDGLNDMERVSYIGAFNAGDTWMQDWTNFDPQNTAY